MPHDCGVTVSARVRVLCVYSTCSVMCSVTFSIYCTRPRRGIAFSLKFGFWLPQAERSRPRSRECLFSVDGPDASVRIRPTAGAPSRQKRARAPRGRAQVPRGAFAAPPSPFRPTT